jgi:glycosyltransferase involved in cell wall biosynthesis
MKILYLVERATQFEAPFFQYAAAHPIVDGYLGEHTLRVLFTASRPGAPFHDWELGHDVHWGIDLLNGYDHGILRNDKRRGDQLEEEVLEGGCDLLITSGYKGHDVEQAVKLARRAGIATALRLDSVVGGSWVRRNARRVRYLTWLRRRYDVFLAAGTETRRFLRSCGIPETRLGLFPYAVDVEQFRVQSNISAAERAAERAKRKVPDTAKVVLAVAKLSPREAPVDLIKALRRLDREVWLIVAGDGPAEEDLRALAAKEVVKGRVSFVGYVDYPKLPVLYAAADLFVHAVRKEHWGVSVAEALACGLPVIASSPVGAGRDLIHRGENGFVYPLDDDKKLASFIKKALKLPRDEVRRVSEEILAKWDYGIAWAGLLDAARRAAASAARRTR